ncbi:MAG TPA: metal-dependent transcriptional regulator [Gemmatimonadota bacterium]|nr:metal-dependent transcriptional regulator [Gemmatimonadota bacterium]
MAPREKTERSGGRRAPDSSGDRSRAVEDYLKAIRILQVEGAPVSTSALAQHLDRSPASVTNMVKNLAERGLVEHRPYHGVQLSAAGEREALGIIRRHRVIEAYLIERLGYSWDEVHAEADRLEHAASDDLVERMAAVLGHPELDPHGSPIPTAEGELAERRHPTLAELRGGARATVREVSDADEGRLRYLAELGLYPGTQVEVLDREPFEGPIRVRVAGAVRSLGKALAEIVSVEPESDEPDGVGKGEHGKD